MEISMDQSVGELVAHFPATSRVFGRYNIDFCCRGKRTLREVGEESVDAAALFAELELVVNAPVELGDRWTDRSASELVEHLVERYHAPLRAELPRLAGLVAAARRAHGDVGLLPFGEIASALDSLTGELIDHLAKEEVVLFPAVERLGAAADGRASIPSSPCGALRFPIQAMEREHEEAGTWLAELRRLTEDYACPPGACPTVLALVAGLEELESELHRHIHLENSVLFPRALELERALVGTEAPR